MDVSTMAAAVSSSAAQTGQSVQIAVLKKTMEIQAQAAAALIETLDSAARLPDHLGKNINTTA